MNLNPHDLHFVFDDTHNRVQCWNAAHENIWKAEMRNSTVNNGTFGHYGNCPRGLFLLGSTVAKKEPAFGFHFTPVLDFGPNKAMAQFGRQGVGVHGGGSGLPHWDAPAQGWVVTHGCLRLQNSANEQFVKLVHDAHAAGGKCYLTVLGEGNGH